MNVLKNVLSNKKVAYWGICLAGAVVLCIFPFIKTGYMVRFMTTLFMYMALSQIWNILGGFAGYISLGLVGFVGLGAYGSAVLMNQGVPFWGTIFASGFLAAVISLIIGYPVLRLKSGYYSIATFGIALVMRELANNATSITGGGMGISFPLLNRNIDEINMYFYFVMLSIAFIVTLLCFRISHSNLGYGLMAIKEDEDAANVLGVNTTIYKLFAFCISSFLAAGIGSVYGYWLTFIDPVSAFDSSLSIQVIIMAMVGGAGTLAGPLIGSVVISIISEFLWNYFMSAHQAILGSILILVVVFMPKGIADIFMFREEKISFASLKRVFSENLERYKI